MKAGITSGWGTVALRTVALTVCCAMSVASSAGEPVMIENESLQVTFDANRSSFSVVDKASRTTFVAAGQLDGRDGAAQVVPVTDATFGDGQQIQITYPSGNREAISLFPRLPFALFHAMLHNASAADVLANHVRVVSADVSMSKPWSELRAGHRRADCRGQEPRQLCLPGRCGSGFSCGNCRRLVDARPGQRGRVLTGRE